MCGGVVGVESSGFTVFSLTNSSAGNKGVLVLSGYSKTTNQNVFSMVHIQLAQVEIKFKRLQVTLRVRCQ